MHDISIKNINFRKLYQETIPSTRYLTHGVHKYTARSIPHIPRYFIKTFTQENDWILDPFCGSGTTALEARLLGRNAIGIDINPLAVLISEVKTSRLNLDETEVAIKMIKKALRTSKEKFHIDFKNIDYWFSKKAQNELSRIRFCIENLKESFNEETWKFLLLCFSTIIRKSSYADTQMAKAYKSKRVRQKIKAGWTPTPIKIFNGALDSNYIKMKALSKRKLLEENSARFFHGSASQTQDILKQNGVRKVDSIITSPPYINAQDYFRSYKFEILWLGLATQEALKRLERQTIGTERISGVDYNFLPKSSNKMLDSILTKIWRKDRKKAHIVYDYFNNMKQILAELHKVLKRRGLFCLVTGNNNICEVEIPTTEILLHMAERNGFRKVEVIRNKIKNRSLPTDRNHNGGFIREEWITVFNYEELVHTD